MNVKNTLRKVSNISSFLNIHRNEVLISKNLRK